MSGLLSRPVVAVASPDDATATASAMESHLDEFGDITLVHVIQKGGGGIDKASIEQREKHAAKAFDAFGEALPTADVETDTVFDTDVADGILAAGTAHDATVIVFTSRGGGWLGDLLAGDVSEAMIADSEIPVLAMPAPPGAPRRE